MFVLSPNVIAWVFLETLPPSIGFINFLTQSSFYFIFLKTFVTQIIYVSNKWHLSFKYANRLQEMFCSSCECSKIRLDVCFTTSSMISILYVFLI